MYDPLIINIPEDWNIQRDIRNPKNLYKEFTYGKRFDEIYDYTTLFCGAFKFESIISRALIKNAIVKSNAKTEVEVAGLKMTVSEAIEYKQVIRYKQELLDILKRQRQIATIDSESHRQRVQAKIDDNIKIICGKDTKADVQTIQSVTDGIMKGDPVEVYDPLNLDKVIKELEVSVEDFTANVDYVLSEDRKSVV
jgi:hypothetical protein